MTNEKADEKTADWTHRLERPAFAALWAFLLAPVLAHGLWRPLLHFFGPSGSAGAITLSALAVSGTIVVTQVLRRDKALLLSLALGGLVALGTGFGWSLGMPGFLTLLLVAAAIACLLHRLRARLPTTLDGLARRHKILAALYVVLALAAVIKTAQLSIFIGDSTRVEHQVIPGEKFIETHSCLTAYVHADALSRKRVDNLYEERFWSGSHGFPPAPAGVESPYRPFVLDYYAYPPPFLLALTPLAALSGNFAAQRALWFGLNGLLLAVGLWLVALWLDGPHTHRVLLLSPIFFGSLPVLATLQVGNFQIAVVVISVLAMVAFERDRPALGGALLAFAILSKISPGVLGILLLGQRRFRSAAWTAGFGILFLALSVLILGVNPLMSFLTYTLPRLSSGDAFGFMDDEPFSILTNMAPFGLPFKLQLMGLNVGDPWVLARRLGRIYSLVLAVLALIAARRAGDRRIQAVMWMSLLVLAALQSPFAPGYVTIGLLWALCLMAVEVRRLQGGISLVITWLLLTVVPAIPEPRLYAAFSFTQSLFTLGVPIWLIVRVTTHVATSDSPESLRFQRPTRMRRDSES